MSETPKPKVYIGSASKSLDYARAVQAHLDPFAECTVWSDGVFPPSQSTLEALENAITRFGFEYAVLVLTPDDERTLDGVAGWVPRDNVLMELGLFVGRLGRGRTFALHHPRATPPTNLSGIATCPIQVRTDGNHVAATAVGCQLIRKAILEHTHRTTTRPAPTPFGVNLHGYRNISESGFVDRTRELVETSKEITFVGTGLNVLHNNAIRERIVQRAREGSLKATICFGNPYSPTVRHRLVEEERGDCRPEVAAQGIVKRVQSLLQLARGVPNLKVRLFNNYPTMSIFSFDSRQFVFYPMGYRKLGNECPVMFVEQPGALGDFLNEMTRNYLADSVDAWEVFRVKVENQRSMTFVEPGEVRAVAVYMIPDKESPFYKAGSDLLGYDVLDGCVLPTSADAETEFFRSHVGGARGYGFHVSASDLMYMPANQIPALTCEVREIAAGVQRFRLSVRDVAEGKYGEHSLALECDEPSGNLECLLTEITVRIRSHALGTNYTLNPHGVRLWHRMTPQEQTFLTAYQSPYVLSRFQPHFTLASPPVPPPGPACLVGTARGRFKDYLRSRTRDVPIDCLYVLSKPLDQAYWNPIREENIVGLSLR